MNQHHPRFNMNQMNQFHVWTALITPMDQQGNIDYTSLAYCVRKQELAGNGIVILGSTGEGLALTENQRETLVQFVMNLNPSVPVMSGVGGFQLPMQLDWIKKCESYGVDAFLMVAPLYAKPGIKGQTQWFDDLLTQANKPCMLYNVPSRTGINLNAELFCNLQHHANLWALKDASGSLEQTARYMDANENLVIYSGEDDLMSDFASIGANGVVSVNANVWPCATKLYMHCCLTDQISLHSIQLWKQATSLLFSASNPIPTKVLLAHMGYINSATLKAPLTSEEMSQDKLEDLIEMNEQMNQWYDKALNNFKSINKRHHVA
jgi:4-hydroxy-tetrahydrodipicolinate synthase